MASPRSKQVSFMLRLRDGFRDYAAATIPSGEINFTSPDGKANWHFILGERLGSGLGGSVHRVDPKSRALSQLGLEGERLVLKIPYGWKLLGKTRPYPHTNRGQEQEQELFPLVMEQMQKISTSRRFPSDPPWQIGTFPAAPIRAALKTRAGTLLLKTELEGEKIGELFKKFGPRPPSPYLDSLKNIHDLAHAFFEKSQVRSARMLYPWEKERARPFLIDINPTNLIWITKPELLKALGLKRPDFAFCELAELPTEGYLKLPFEGFLEEFALASAYEARHS